MIGKSMKLKRSEKILDDPCKKVNEATNTLAALFRIILTDRKTGIDGWLKMVNQYLDHPDNEVKRNGKDRSSARGNLQKEVFRNSMTFKVFRKALLVLNPKNITLTISLEWRDGTTTHHSAMMTNTAADIDAEEIDYEETDDFTDYDI